MKVTQEKLPASQVGLQIEVSAEASQKAYDDALRKYMRSAKIPGFRKGKVPKHVLVQRFGASNIKASVIEDLVQDSVRQAIEQEKVEVLGNIQLRSSFEELLEQFQPGSTLTFSASADVMPEPSISTYTGFQVQAEEIVYDPAKVDEMLKAYQERQATLVPIEDRPAQLGDTAVIDFEATVIPKEGEAEEEVPEFPGSNSVEGYQFELNNESSLFAGLVDGIVGMQPDEVKEIQVSFPDDYPNEPLAGRSATLNVTLKELKEKELPELDDDFAQEISDFETIAELRETMEKNFREEAEYKTKNNKHEALLDELVQNLEVELPRTLIGQEVDQMVSQTAYEFASKGMDVKRIFTQEIVQRLREQAQPEAVASIKESMVIDAIAAKENITVEDSAVQEKLESILEGRDQEGIDLEKLREIVKSDLLKDAVLKYVEDESTVELVPEGSLAEKESEEVGDETAEDETEPVEPVESASTAVVDVEAVSEPEDTSDEEED